MGKASLSETAKKLVRLGDSYIEKNGIKDFHKKASDLLSTSDLHKKYHFQELVELSLNSDFPQNFKNLEFSDLPLTISHGKNCFIDVYFWRRRPTVIHNHHFAGAFMCLEGSNVDLEFLFKKERKLGKYHDLGTLTLKRERNMKPGDIAEIGLMNKFIHQNHHQADLTINLCFRTPQEKNKSLSNYLYSGLRFEKNQELMGRARRLERFLHLGSFKDKDLKITPDDGIHFLIQTFETRSENPRLLKLRSSIDKKIKEELGVDVSDLLKKHDATLSEREDNYV